MQVVYRPLIKIFCLNFHVQKPHGQAHRPT
jgi:hypothetical protein